MKTDLKSELEFLQFLAEPGEESFVLPDLYTAAIILYSAVILKTGLRAAAAEDVYYMTAYVAVMFQDSIIRRSWKNETDLMSELEFLQLLAELGEGCFLLPDIYTALPEFLDSTLL
jgi:hypothetical protein